VNLDGGILETERIRISKGSATGNFTLACNFDGGTLKLPAVAPTGTSGVLLGNVADDGGGTTAFITTLEDGGLVLDTNGRDTTITTILSHDATLGTALDGGLTKNGLGKLTLAVENTYTGETKVNAGVLAVNGSSIIDTGKLVISAGRVEVTGTETVGSLFFGSVQQAAGIWGSSASTAVAPFVDDTRFSGNGVVIVDTGTAGASYASWAAGFSAPALADPAAMADPDVDGLANSVEYVIGGDPRISSQAGRPVSSVSGGNLVFTFYRVDSSETPDASVSVQTSNDLADWTASPVYSVGADTLSSSAGVVVAENGANPDFITVTIPAASKKFARLSVMTP
jgi:autotransporter-associated beta strand protein